MTVNRGSLISQYIWPYHRMPVCESVETIPYEMYSKENHDARREKDDIKLIAGISPFQPEILVLLPQQFLTKIFIVLQWMG